MNPAILIYTFARHFRPTALLGLFGYTVLLPLFLSSVSTGEEASSLLTPLITGPTLPMVIAYSFVQSTVANSRSINDGEYLALLFSRPLSRASYVLTKWIAGSIAVSTIVVLQLFIFYFAQSFQGHDQSRLISEQSIANLILNSISYTALVVCISSVPMKLGLPLFFCIVYISLFGSMLPSMVERSTDPSTANSFSYILVAAIGNIFQTLQGFVLPSIDLFSATSNTTFSWLPFANYISNVLVYLTIATLIMSRREFFYAAE